VLDPLRGSNNASIVTLNAGLGSDASTNHDPKVTRELAVMRVLFPLIGLLICVAVVGLYLWRLHHFKRSVATIEAVWEEEVGRRGVTVITMAELSFSRTASTGEPSRDDTSLRLARLVMVSRSGEARHRASDGNLSTG
jgi:hypothetical protein